MWKENSFYLVFSLICEWQAIFKKQQDKIPI